jgi:hypothetical protein
MTRIHALALLAASALTAAVGLPAVGAVPDPSDRGERPAISPAEDNRTGAPLMLASGGEDDDDDDDDDDRRASRERERDHDDECDDDDDDCGGNAAAPAPVPAGPGAPARTPLFGTGAPPQAKVN